MGNQRTDDCGSRQRGRTGLGGSALGVVGEALPVDDDAWLIADDPGVMAWCHRGEVAGAVLHFFAIVHNDLDPT